jgi:hypothetical protein
MSYYSPIYDATHWKSIAWWLECYGSMPGVSGPPVTAYIETSESLTGPWDDMIPGGASVSAGQVSTGALEDPASLVRVRVEVQAGEISTVALRLIARPR